MLKRSCTEIHTSRWLRLSGALSPALFACACGGVPSPVPDAVGGTAPGIGGRGVAGGQLDGAAGAAPVGGASGASGGGSGGAAGYPNSTGGALGTGGDPATTGGALGMGGSPGGSAGQGGAGSAGAAGNACAAAPAKFVGNITTNGEVRSDFIGYWNQITPENEGKWGSVEGTRDQMNWAGLDAVYAYSKEHCIPFKQHTFVWGSQQPNWIAGLSQAEQRAEVEEWIRLFCERYPDTHMIDVVNEPPPHTTPPYAAALGGAGASGYDWIVQSFKWARQYCPNSILILNDYNIIEYGAEHDHFIDVLKKAKNAGAPIDAIGAHAHAAFSVPTDMVKGYIDHLASSTGLPVYISEYDINVADDNQQKNIMQSQFTMFWTHNSVKGVTLWGYVKGSTWLENTGLVTNTGQKRPALTWLTDYLAR